jgi:hypothetical protein
VLPETQQLQQVLDYVGHSRGGKTAGRKFPIQSGIIGWAVRAKKTANAFRAKPDYNEYLDELVTKWGYTPEDAKRLDRDSMAWLAIPLENQNKEVEGVLYIDSVDPAFFTDTRINLAHSAAAGIAVYAGKRYN